MMELTLFDHIIVAFLVLVTPVLSVTDWRKFLSQIDAGKPSARCHFYRATIAWSWGFTIAIAVLWLVYKRPLPELGLGFEIGTGFWIGLALTVAACGMLLVQLMGLKRDPDKLQAMAKQFESVMAMIPRTNREAKEFTALSITAGICEEIIYRGYLMLYISSVIAVGGMWTAAIGSSIAFGLGHTYQGPKGVVKVCLVGLAFAGLYLLTGSIWLPIVLHTVMDLAYGSLGRALLRRERPLAA